MAASNTMLQPNFDNLTTLRGIQAIIFDEWQQREAVGRKIFNVKDSNQFREDSLTIGGVGIMDVKAEGQEINYDSLVEGFRETFTHVDYAMGMRASEILVRDDLYGVIEKRGQELARSAHATEETLLASHFNNATSASYLGPDGVALGSNSHLVENGSTFDNLATTALSATSLEAAIIAFRGFVDGGGKKLQIRPKVLLIPPSLQFTAARLINSTYYPERPLVDSSGTAGVAPSENAINPVEGLGIKVVVWDYLTDTNDWFLLADKRDHHMVMFEREAFHTDAIEDFDTGDFKVKGQFAQSSGWEDWRGVYVNAV